MKKGFIRTANLLRFSAIFAVLVLSACTGGGGYKPAGQSSGASALDALTGASIAALPQLGEVFFTGTVQSISDTSVQIADIVFRTDDQTSWAQNLTVGSTVRVRALELPDSTRYAVDVQSVTGVSAPASVVQFNFHDVVVSISDTSWVIGDQTVMVDASTMIETGILVGDLVEVEGTVVNGALLASKIKLESSGSITPTPEVTPAPVGMTVIELTGKLDAIDSASLQVGGLTFAITAMTEIKGILAAGDIVKVEGWRAADGTLTAKEVKLADFDKLPIEGTIDVEIKGVVESMSASLWVIGGFNVAVDASTEVSSSLAVGSFAKAEGTLQADGSLLAREIKPAEMDDDGDDDGQGEDDDGDDDGMPGDDNEIEFSGIVESISAGLWVIAGKSVIVTAETEIEGSPQMGDFVKVKAFSANGSLTADEIKIKSTQSGGDDDDDMNGDDDHDGTPGVDDDHDDDDDDHGGTSTPEPGDDDGGDDDDGDDNEDDGED